MHNYRFHKSFQISNLLFSYLFFWPYEALHSFLIGLADEFTIVPYLRASILMVHLVSENKEAVFMSAIMGSWWYSRHKELETTAIYN